MTKLYLTRYNMELRAGTAENPLPKGVCGQLVAKILTYGVVDAEGTAFAAGCLDRTKNEKVAAGKVPVFSDHKHDSAHHIGVVKKLETVGNVEVMTADLFDDDAGRAAKEKLQTVKSAGGFSGYSVGVLPRSGAWTKIGDDHAYQFSEAEMMECSTTPMPAVPGTGTMSLRSTAEQRVDLLETTARTILSSIDPAKAAVIASEFVLKAAVVTPPVGQSDAAGHPPIADSGADTPARASQADREATVRRLRQFSAEGLLHHVPHPTEGA